MKHVIKAFRLLDAREQRQAWLVLATVVFMALFDTLGTVSIMPFLAVLANPALIGSNHVLAWLHQSFDFKDDQSFLFFLGLCAFGLMTLSAIVRSLGVLFVNRFIQMRSYSIGSRLLETYLRQPYSFFLHRHTGDMAKDLLGEIAFLIAQVYQPAATLVAQGMLLIVLLALMIAVNPGVALIGAVVLGTCYGTIYLLIRAYLYREGHHRTSTLQERFRVTAEALGGIKTVKLLAREKHYLSRFDDASLKFSSSQATSTTLSMIPRYAIEAIAFGGIILLTLALMLRYKESQTGALGEVLPLLGFYVFAGYRILPAVQGIYQSLTQLRFGASAIDGIAADLAMRDQLPLLPAKPAIPLPFSHKIEMKDLSYSYPKAERASLSNISLTIPSGSTLGIVGGTGAGKTTLVDLFLGLLSPDSGEILVDGIRVTPENVRAWQADLGYVPQEIFLTDASVAENIAFGLPPALIDRTKVRDAARMAQILEFVETQMPQGLDTPVGERGVRLSGGQRQRIGIARALYSNPGVLVFDEATSALDNLTEQEVVRAINELTGTKTIILIAHRISTVKDCDQILVLEHGRIVGIGTYDALYRDTPAFRRLVDVREEA